MSRLFLNNLKPVLNRLVRRCKSDLASVNEKDGFRRVVLKDKKTRNSLSMDMLEILLCAVQQDIGDTNLRGIVITAEGNVFSAGHNLKHMMTDEGKKVFDRCGELMMSIVDCPVPVVAAVDGLAAAAGCQLVAQCDIAICTQRSSFSTPGANFGVFCSTPGIPLVRTVPRKVATDMLFTGLPISSQKALAAGLVSRVVEDTKLEDEINVICNAIKAKSRSVVELGKRFFYRQIEMNLHSAYDEGKNVMLRNLKLDDGKEGLRSFAEKRKPIWVHAFTQTEKS